MEYKDFIVLSKRNKEFLEGQREIGGETQSIKIKILLTLPFALLLLCGVAENALRFNSGYLMFFILAFGFVFGHIFFSYKDIENKRTLYRDGTLLEGTISKLEEIRYGDDPGYEVTISFMDSKKTTVIVNRSQEFEVGKKMLILYLSKDNFAVM